MRVSSLALRVFLAAEVAEAFHFLSGFSTRQPRSFLKPTKRRRPQIALQEQNEKSFWDYFKFEPDPKLRKSLGIKNGPDNHDDKMTPRPPENPPPGPYFSEDTGRQLPDWTPPPDLSIPYDAAAKLAYEKSEPKASYAEFKAKYETDAVADVIRKNGSFSKKSTSASKEPEKAKSASRTSTLFDTSDTEKVGKVTKVVVDTIVSPLIGPEIEKGVPIKTIQGACFTAVFLSLFILPNINLAAIVLLLTALFSISPGPVGATTRTVGSLAYEVGETFFQIIQQFGVEDIMNKKSQTAKQTNFSTGGTMQQLGDQGEGVLKEGEDAVATERNPKRKSAEKATATEYTEPMLEKKQEVDLSIPYDAAARLAYESSNLGMTYELFRNRYEADAVADVIATRQKGREQEAKLENERKFEEEKQRAEEARLAAKAEEEKRLAEEQKQAKERQAAEEEAARMAAKAEEEKRLAEEQKHAIERQAAEVEEARLAAKAEEEKRLAEEQQRAKEREAAEEEEARLAAEAQRLADEEAALKEAALDTEPDDVDDEDFSDMDWEASIELAKDNVEGKIVGIYEGDTDESAKEEWDAAGSFAQSLGKQPEMFNDEEPPVAADLEALARAAREAVEKFEKENGGDNYDLDDDEEDFFDITMDEDASSDDIAAAARKAVEVYENEGQEEEDEDDEKDFGNDEDIDLFFDDEAPEDSAPEGVRTEGPTQDWSTLTVANLKEELKSRGLPTAGKKTDLVAMLKESDKELMDMPEASAGSGSGEEIDFSAMDLEEIARAAREAAELYDGDEPSDEVLMQLESEGLDLGIEEDSVVAESGGEGITDLESMTVAELKEELRSRGLKVSGKKAELIERLQSSE